MANSIKYNSAGLFIGKRGIYDSTTTGDFLQIKGLQSVQFGIDNQINILNSVGTNEWNYYKTNPTVNTSITYLLTNGNEEYVLGISGASGMSNLYDKQCNLYYCVDSNGRDINSLSSLSGIYVSQFTNSVLTNYNIEAQLFKPITVGLNFQSFNTNIQTYTSGILNGAIELVSGIETSNLIQLPLFETGFGTGVKFLTPNNMILTVGTGLIFGTTLQDSDVILNGFNIGINFERNTLNKLGYKYPYKRCLSFPVDLTVSLTATFLNFKEDSLSNIFCNDRLNDMIFSFRRHCDVDNEVCRFEFSGLKFVNQSSEISVGQRKTISFSFNKKMDATDAFTFWKYNT